MEDDSSHSSSEEGEEVENEGTDSDEHDMDELKDIEYESEEAVSHIF